MARELLPALSSKVAPSCAGTAAVIAEEPGLKLHVALAHKLTHKEPRVSSGAILEGTALE